MPWVKLDEQFARNPKVLQAGPLGLAMQVAALCYCNEYLTDGFVPRSVAKTLLDFEGIAYTWQHNDLFGGGNDVEPDMVIKQLLEAGVWDEIPGGYSIHDYLEYQPSKAEVLAQRQQRVEAGRQGGLAKAKRGAKQTASEVLSEVLSEMPSKRSSKTLAKVYPVPVPVLEEAKASSRGDEQRTNREGGWTALENREGVWTALEDLFGEAAETERKLRGKVVRSLVNVGGTYSEVKARAAVWPKLFPRGNGGAPLTLTATALEKWWGQLGLIVETGRPPPDCPICGNRRLVGVTSEGEVVSVELEHDQVRQCSCVGVK